jgi:hypothetical protein
MRTACLVLLLCGCNESVSLTDLKQPLLTLSTHAPDAFCDQYIALDGDNVIWAETGCDSKVLLDKRGFISADDRTTIEAKFETARGDAHPVCGASTDVTSYHAEHSSPLFEGFDACESQFQALAPPATVSFIHTMKGLVP